MLADIKVAFDFVERESPLYYDESVNFSLIGSKIQYDIACLKGGRVC